MTTLNPSHFPWKARDGDPATGAAVHTSVAPAEAVASSSSSPSKAARATTSAGRGGVDGSTSDSDLDADEDIDWMRRRRRAATRHERKKLDREEARAHGRIPTIPVPDVRFEQSYLMSIQPFMQTRHSRTIDASSSMDEDDDTLHANATPSKVRREKRRRVEENLALVENPASRSGGPIDELLHPSSNTTVSIQWGQIAYVTFRDQVLSPLVQGTLWAFGGILFSSMYAGWKTTTEATTPPSRRPLRGFLERLLGPLTTRKAQTKRL